MSSIQKDLIDPNEVFPDALRFMENSVIEFLRAIFSKFPEGQLRYADDNSSEIQIMGRDTDNLEVVDTRPRMIVSRGPVAWQNRGIANMVGSRSLSRADRTYADINSGTVGVSCYSREALEADRIANIAFNALKMYQQVLKEYGYLDLKAAQVGQRAKIKSDSKPELFVTPVLIQTQVTINWKASYGTPTKLKKINVSVTTD